MIMENRNKKNGFTLVEVLVAVTIVATAVAGVFTAVQSSLQKNSFTENKITAYYLAVEGMEFIRNWRDENGIKNIQALNSGSSVYWLSGIYQNSSNPCYGKSCIIDSPAKTVTACSSGPTTCPNVRYNSTTRLYGHNSSWNSSIFRRSITISTISATEVLVTVSVYWTEQNNSKTYTISEILRSWQ